MISMAEKLASTLLLASFAAGQTGAEESIRLIAHCGGGHSQGLLMPGTDKEEQQ
jgi:hypothetical protein